MLKKKFHSVISKILRRRMLNCIELGRVWCGVWVKVVYSNKQIYIYGDCNTIMMVRGWLGGSVIVTISVAVSCDEIVVAGRSEFFK